MQFILSIECHLPVQVLLSPCRSHHYVFRLNVIRSNVHVWCIIRQHYMIRLNKNRSNALVQQNIRSNFLSSYFTFDQDSRCLNRGRCYFSFCVFSRHAPLLLHFPVSNRRTWTRFAKPKPLLCAYHYTATTRS